MTMLHASPTFRPNKIPPTPPNRYQFHPSFGSPRSGWKRATRKSTGCTSASTNGWLDIPRHDGAAARKRAATWTDVAWNRRVSTNGCF